MIKLKTNRLCAHSHIQRERIACSFVNVLFHHVNLPKKTHLWHKYGFCLALKILFCTGAGSATLPMCFSPHFHPLAVITTAGTRSATSVWSLSWTTRLWRVVEEYFSTVRLWSTKHGGFLLHLLVDSGSVSPAAGLVIFIYINPLPVVWKHFEPRTKAPLVCAAFYHAVPDRQLS